MRKKIDRFIKSDFKLGQFLVTTYGTGFIIGFSDNPYDYYFYKVDNMYIGNIEENLKNVEGYIDHYIQYLDIQGVLLLNNVLNPNLIRKISTYGHKKYIDLRYDETIVKKWRTKSQLLNGDNTVYIDDKRG